MSKSVFLSNQNPAETKEWLDALRDVVEVEGIDWAIFLVNHLIGWLRTQNTLAAIGTRSPMCNTLPTASNYPAHEAELAEKVHAAIAWNAAAMVAKAANKASELGGHIATYASISDLYAVALDYFCRGRGESQLEDIVYFQGHSTPGIYARAFLENRLTQKQLEHFRQETQGRGICSYPHPWSMPDFWQFATVSMGLTAVQSIYQARFQKYLMARKLLPESDRKIWAFMGDGEMDEIESLGGIRIAARENLDNLIYVINCNLQRLDGPVCANHNVIDELEGMFIGAGWRVIKVIWNSAFDRLFAKDHDGYLLAKLSNLNDGQLQRFAAFGLSSIRHDLFDNDPKLKAMVADWTEEDWLMLKRGGHDPAKIFTAYQAAMTTKGQPVALLMMTTKGKKIKDVAGKNTAHNTKKMTKEALVDYAKALKLPISDEAAGNGEFYHPGPDSPEAKFLRQKRQTLGGYLPKRYSDADVLKTPDLSAFEQVTAGSGDREVSSTMMFVRILGLLLRDEGLKERIVPIVPDESRTFGMEGLFRQIGIYSSAGQQYEPVDSGSIMSYKESTSGQYIQEGVNEGGAISTWIAAATSYSTNQLSMIPFYVYYSMFGFQRVGDYIWAAGDMRARGFLIGGTAGRTTLAGEGVQHNDGNSLHISNLISNCVSYDPTYGYELAVIIRHGIKRMYENQEDVFFYISVMNENYLHPKMPADCEAGIIKGMYCLHEVNKPQIHLLSSGTILLETERAQKILKEQFNVVANVWSATSFTELAREARAVERHNRVHIDQPSKTSYVADCLKDGLPVVAATDYASTYPEQITPYIKNRMTVLGTDGYGRSDTRVALRHFHEVSAEHIAYTALYQCYLDGQIEQKVLVEARKTFNIPDEDPQDTLHGLYQGLQKEEVL